MIDMRSMMLPAVSLLSRAPAGTVERGAGLWTVSGSTSPSASSRISSMRSVASLRAWLKPSMARLLAAISRASTVVRRARSSSAQSWLLKRWLAWIHCHRLLSGGVGSVCGQPAVASRPSWWVATLARVGRAGREDSVVWDWCMAECNKYSMHYHP